MTTASGNDSSSGAGPVRYIAVIVMASSSDAPDYEPLYEECFVLIEAVSPEEAREKALALAGERGTEYRNEMGETIRWSFHRLIDVNRLLEDSLEDGAELYARHFRNYEAYEAFEELAQNGPRPPER
jgi:hypothetical protein